MSTTRTTTYICRCPACRALLAWDTAVFWYRAAQSTGTYGPTSRAAADRALAAQRALSEVTIGAPIDPLRVETPFTVAYGH